MRINNFIHFVSKVTLMLYCIIVSVICLDATSIGNAISSYFSISLFLFFIIAINVAPFLILTIYIHKSSVLWTKITVLMTFIGLFLYAVYVLYYSLDSLKTDAQGSFVFVLLPVMQLFPATLIIIFVGNRMNYIYRIYNRKK